MSVPGAGDAMMVARSQIFLRENTETTRDAAYRRLAVVILRLDVASLDRDLRAARVGVRLAEAA